MLWDYLSGLCTHSRRQGGELPAASPVFLCHLCRACVEKHCPLSMAFDKINQIRKNNCSATLVVLGMVVMSGLV